MNAPAAASSQQSWQRCTRGYTQTLPVLAFPLDKPPHIYAPANTILRVGEQVVQAFLWCYLRRDVQGGNRSSFDPTSLSGARVNALPVVLQRLSQWMRFRNVRPRSVERQLRHLGALLSWADESENEGRFETLLSDPGIALQALKGYHSYLRGQLQSHRLKSETAGRLDQDAIACLSEIHDRRFNDLIEPLQALKGQGTKAPDARAVSEFGSTLQAIFDSAAALVLSESANREGSESEDSDLAKDVDGAEAVGRIQRTLRVSVRDSRLVLLRDSFSTLRLMELACVAYAGLALADSGANLAVLQQYEEPDDLEDQLAEPDRINLTMKVLKFRAGGKVVEVHLSATTMTRLRTYLRVRQALIDALGADVAPMFVQCDYDTPRGKPIAVHALRKEFLTTLRKRVKAAGVSLPEVTLRQLRAYKQQDVVRKHGVGVTAKMMGHSVQTAVKAYCKAQESVRQGEMAAFLLSMQRTILQSPESPNSSPQRQVIPIGVCMEHGKPAKSSVNAPSQGEVVAVVEPDCRKVEGCFFCENYRVHADEQDMRKLMSCRRVLKQIAPLTGDSVRAERIYTAVVDRIEALLVALQRREPKAYEAAREDIERRGHLTEYWARKLQQLHLLGILPTN